MIGTAVAQLRFAASVVFGLPFAPWALDRLLNGTLASYREFGALSDEGAELLGGPVLSESDRRHVQLRRFRSQAARAARETVYYAALFDRLQLDPARLTYEHLSLIPPTPKTALRDDPDAFVCRRSSPVFRTTTTGTTGRPTSVSFSARELHAYVALAGIGALFKGDLQPDDVAQISTSARATLGNTCFAGAAARLGAQVYLTGVVDPALALSQLAERRRLAGRRSQTSVLQVYPSYLGELVECGLALGYGPNDFGLERIFVGGEIVTAGLKHRAEHLFGQAIRFGEGYAMTETWPLAGTRCSQGHLHFEPSQALLEVLDPDTQASSAPGEPGTAVVTPLPPYRETTLLLRYDTEDVVRALDAVPLTCELRNIPATSDVQGKLRLAARHEYGWTFPRDVLEVLEGMEEVPLPARCGFWAVPGGVAVEVLVRSDSLEVKRQIAQHLEDGGIPLRELNLVTDGRALRNPLPLRCDLREASFSTGQAEPLSAGIGLST